VDQLNRLDAHPEDRAGIHMFEQFEVFCCQGAGVGRGAMTA